MPESHEPTTPPSPDLLAMLPRELAGLDAGFAERYIIERELARGGMATVYLARDVKHGRLVALKVLSPDLRAELGSERFLEEIRTTAALQHPHILALLDSGDAGGRLFYVMPYVEGETLRSRLNGEGTLPILEAARLGAQLAAALDYAHQRGVVHRDIKPENVLLSHGLPVLADFGIAYAARRARDERLTLTGTSLGTPTYMSPEQVIGEREVDGRSDIYSLGCVLFEMLAGRAPFRGATANATMFEHATAPVPALASPRGSIPAALEQAVRRTLAKDPAERFRTAGELAEALLAATIDTGRRPGAGPRTMADDQSIAVLPFANLSPDPENAFFADGLTEEVIADLSKVKALRVISRTSAMRYRDTEKSVETISRELGVRYVLEGSVRRAGNALRVTAQLIDAVTDGHLWAEKYGGALDDVFEIQERLAREIVGALKVTLTPEESRRVGAGRVRDAAAYDCYLRARQLMLGGTSQSYAAAKELLDRAVTLSGESPPALASLALYEALLTQTAIDSDPAHFDAALALAARAVELDPDCAEAYAVMGIVHKSRGEVREAARAFRRALAIEPNHADALGWFIFVLAECDRIAESRDLAARLAATNPFDPTIDLWQTVIDFFDGRFDDVFSDVDRWERADPSNAWPVCWRALALLALDRRAEVADLLPRMQKLFAPTVGAAFATITQRRFEGAVPILDSLSAEQLAVFRRDTELSYFVASSLAHVGEREAAVDWARNSVRLGLLSYPFLTRHDRFLASLRGYPPFDALLAEVEATWRTLEL